MHGNKHKLKQDRILWCWQDWGWDSHGPDRRHPPVQRRIRTRDGIDKLRCAGSEYRDTDHCTDESGCQRQDLRQDHARTDAGKSRNKFGIPISRAFNVYAPVASLPGLETVGIDIHIGSRLTEPESFEPTYANDVQRIQHTPLIPEVLVNGDQFAIIRECPGFDKIINRVTILEWPRRGRRMSHDQEIRLA